MFQIKNKDFLIREFLPSDYEALLSIADSINNQAENKTGYQPFYAFQVSKKKQDYFTVLQQKTKRFLSLALCEKDVEPRKTYRLALCNNQNRVIGNITIDVLPSLDENGNKLYGDVGYFIDPNYGRKGLMSRALAHVLNVYFKNNEMLDITIHPNNLYSIKMMQRFNAKVVDFKPESSYGNEPRLVLKLSRADFLLSRKPIYITTKKQPPNNNNKGRIKDV